MAELTGKMAKPPEQYAQIFRQLSPRGSVWELAQDRMRQRFWLACADEFARASQRQDDLLREALPLTTVEMIDVWEASWGITPAAGDTLEERRAAVVSRMLANGNQNASFYELVGDNFGLTVTVEKYRPSQFGDRFGTPWRSTDWRYAWLFKIEGTGPQSSFERLVAGLVPLHIMIGFQYLGGA